MNRGQYGECQNRSYEGKCESVSRSEEANEGKKGEGEKGFFLRNY